MAMSRSSSWRAGSKAVWNKLWCKFGYILVPEMAVLMQQVELARIWCYAGFCVHDVFWFEKWKKKSMLHVDSLV